jgi:hypothetical protein
VTTTNARDRMKQRLGIDATVTVFDSLIDALVLDAVNRLAPKAYREVPSQLKTVTVDFRGQTVIDLSTLSIPVEDVRMLESSDGDLITDHDSFQIHAGILTVRGLTSDVIGIYIYGLVPYTLSDLKTLLELAVFYFAQSEFYSTILGDKRQYNVYMQNGGPATDEMKSLVQFFEDKGVVYLEEKGQLYGR